MTLGYEVRALRLVAVSRCISRFALPLGVALGLTGCSEDGKVIWRASPADASAKTLSIGMSAVDSNLRDIIHTKAGRFIAVGAGDHVFVANSSDNTFVKSLKPAGSIAPGAELLSVAADEDGGIVAVGRNGSIWTIGKSNNSLEKPRISLRQAESWLSVVGFAQGHYVAVGVEGAIVVSSDGGQSFSQPILDAPTREALTSVAADLQGRIVVVGTRGLILVSTDNGKSFARPAGGSGTQESLESVTADGLGHFIAVGAAGTVVVSTNDMTAFAPPVNVPAKIGHLRVVASDGRGTVVAAGEQGDVLFSRDGGVKFERSAGVPQMWASRAVSTGVGTFLIAGGVGPQPDGATGILLKSDDGGSLFKVLPSQGEALASLASVASDGAGHLMAVGAKGLSLSSTDDGRTFDTPPCGAGMQGPIRDIVGNGAGRVAAIFEAGLMQYLLLSTDGGMRCALRPFGLDRGRPLNRMVFNGRQQIVAVGSEGRVLVSRNDGERFDIPEGGSSTAEALNDVTGQGEWLTAVGVAGAIVVSNDGGDHFTAAKAETHRDLQAVAMDANGRTVAVGESGAIVQSQKHGDGFVPVTGRYKSRATLRAVTAAGKASFVVVGDHGAIAVSKDAGKTFDPPANDSGVSSRLLSLAADDDGSIVAVGERGAIVRSSDGGSTFSVPYGGSPTAETLVQVISDKAGRFVVVGDFGALLISLDGGKSFTTLGESSGTPDRSIAGLAPTQLGHFSFSGRNGEWLRGAFDRDFPRVQLVRHRYSASLNPILSIALEDPSQSCAMEKCLHVAVATEEENKFKKTPTSLPERYITYRPDGVVEVDLAKAVIDPPAGKDVLARISVKGAGYSYIYGGIDGYLSIENNPSPIWKETWFLSLGSSVLVALILGALFVAHPLGLLSLTMGSDSSLPSGEVGPAWTKIPVWFARSLLLPLLSKSPRVLDSWTSKYNKELVNGFERSVASAVGLVPPYVPLPIQILGGTTIDQPSASSLASHLRADATCLQLVGCGGAGKTRLAIQIGRWISEGPTQGTLAHVAFPIFIDEEFGDLRKTISDRLRALSGQSLPERFVTALIESARIVPVIDRVSERSTSTIDTIRKIHHVIRPGLLILTARHALAMAEYSGRIVQIEVLSLAPDKIALYLNQLLADYKAGEVFPSLSSQLDLQRRFADQITVAGREMPVTPLLVKIFVDEAIALGRQKRSINELPRSVPEAYFGYIEQLAASRSDKPSSSRAQISMTTRVAIGAARVELGDDYRPKEIHKSALMTVLQLKGDTFIGARFDQDTLATQIALLVSDGLLIEGGTRSEPTLKFILDPLAECLAAYSHVRECGSDAVLWDALVRRLVALGPSGFLAAIQMNYLAYREAFEFPLGISFGDDLPPIDAS